MHKFKVGDKVRFRMDGDIGMHNKMYFEVVCDVNEEYVVLEVSRGMVAISIDDDYWVTPIQIEPVPKPKPKPKFADIKVGDWVEWDNSGIIIYSQFINYEKSIASGLMRVQDLGKQTSHCISDCFIIRIIPAKEVKLKLELKPCTISKELWEYGYIDLRLLSDKSRAEAEELLKQIEDEK